MYAIKEYLLDGMTLSTAGLEELCSIGKVPFRNIRHGLF